MKIDMYVNYGWQIMVPAVSWMVLLSVWMTSFTMTTTGELPTPAESVSYTQNNQYVQRYASV